MSETEEWLKSFLISKSRQKTNSPGAVQPNTIQDRMADALDLQAAVATHGFYLQCESKEAALRIAPIIARLTQRLVKRYEQ